MENENRTVFVKRQPQQPQPAQTTSQDLLLTVFDAGREPYTLPLRQFNKKVVTFGRDEADDIRLSSRFASRRHNGVPHGCFVWEGNHWRIDNTGGTNGLIYNDAPISSRVLCEGDILRIDSAVRNSGEGVLFVFSSSRSVASWQSQRLDPSGTITIGRDASCTITLPHISVSRLHASIRPQNGRWVLVDEGSTNGVMLNGQQIHGPQTLSEKDVLSITNSKLIFTSNAVYFATTRNGITVDANDVVIERGRGRKKFITSNHVSLNIRPGELVAIIGGSGAGKSTILNALCGYLPPASGNVFINGVNLYRNFDSLKKLVGYVPQSDIVYDNLTLHDMLEYTAKLRLPPDISPQERDAAIDRAIATVELTDKKGSLIRSLSGGQRKRASIAVELLSDPNLLFLDEPASGLDPGTERNLMHSLRKMADGGKTVVLVTHSTLQLRMCDKIVFMGRGGNLCFFGNLDSALRFFGVSDVVDVYNMITENAPQWRDRYQQMARPAPIQPEEAGKLPRAAGTSRIRQLGVLCARYARLVINDRQRLILLMVQAPLLALLISFVANDQKFVQYEMTKSLLFALSCCAFWIGMLNSIQEICKERSITRREYMTGLSLTSYVLSKILVLGLLCMVQSALVIIVFALRVGAPDAGVLLPPLLELYVTTFLTALSAAAMGLFVSSLFTNADRAMTVAPILLMPQILFSGIIFALEGVTEVISWFAVCRWSMEGYGTTADLNNLVLRLPSQLGEELADKGVELLMHPIEGDVPILSTTVEQTSIDALIPHNAEDFFNFTRNHMLLCWGILLAFVIVFLIGARIVLQGINKDNG